MGDSGNGTLNINAGGLVTNTLGLIADDSGSTSSVVVAGTDGAGTPSTWNNSGTLAVGRFGDGTLDITGGGLVMNADGGIGQFNNSSGFATVAGSDGSGNRSTWTNTGSLDVGASGNGILNILTGGVVTNTTNGIIAVSSDSTSFVNVDGVDGLGNPSTWTVGSELQVGGSGDGTLNITGGGRVTSSEVSIARQSGSSSALYVSGAGSTLEVSGGLGVGGSSVFSLGGIGTMTLETGGTVSVGTTLRVWNSSTLDLTGGTLDVGALALEAASTFNMTGGRLEADNVTGDLTIVGGTFDPDAASGTTIVGGDYEQQAGATLEIEIGGTGAGEFDTLRPTNDATLSGMLDVQLVDLGGGVYVPSAGDTFIIVRPFSGSLNGTFSGGVSFPALTGQLTWNIDYDLVGDLVVLEVSTPFTADFDGDGDVDDLDLAQWEISYGIDDMADANGDGRSNGLDFLAWQQQFTGDLSSPLAAAAVVPEPSTTLLAAFGLLVLTPRRKGA